MSHTPTSPRSSSPLVILSAAAMFAFSTLFGLAIMTGTKIHLEASAAVAVTLGILSIAIGSVVAVGAILTDRNG